MRFSRIWRAKNLTLGSVERSNILSTRVQASGCSFSLVNVDWAVFLYIETRDQGWNPSTVCCKLTWDESTELYSKETVCSRRGRNSSSDRLKSSRRSISNKPLEVKQQSIHRSDVTAAQSKFSWNFPQQHETTPPRVHLYLSPNRGSRTKDVASWISKLHIRIS